VVEHRATLGAPASGEVLAYTGTTRVVTVPLEVDRQHLVKVGLAAAVSLPDGSTVTGRVARIGTVATSAGAGQGATGGPPGQGERQAPPTVDVTVTIADQAKLGTLDAAPVDLMLTVSKRVDVLTVPVAALVALAEGGYGVQVAEGTSSRYMAVTTGMFAGGKVEIAGAGIREGLAVVVPA
jgi:multidrug efflux system membrane fusion protein